MGDRLPCGGGDGQTLSGTLNRAVAKKQSGRHKGLSTKEQRKVFVADGAAGGGGGGGGGDGGGGGEEEVFVLSVVLVAVVVVCACPTLSLFALHSVQWWKRAHCSEKEK